MWTQNASFYSCIACCCANNIKTIVHDPVLMFLSQVNYRTPGRIGGKKDCHFNPFTGHSVVYSVCKKSTMYRTSIGDRPNQTQICFI